MSTIKTRLENKLGGRYCDGNCELFHCANVKKFFRQELLALADAVENSRARSVFEVAAFIRSKADELK